jgi:hypothetical protein
MVCCGVAKKCIAEQEREEEGEEGSRLKREVD